MDEVTLDEFSLIRQWTSSSRKHPHPAGLTVGIGDDAAVFSVTAGREVVACCDAMIETVHFLRETMNVPDIGYKALVSNISDIAAMGGIPRFALITIGVSPGWSAEECRQLYEGIYEAAERYGVAIIGGDTVSTPDALHLSITVLGEVENGKALLRSSAKPGHIVFTTGTIGDSAAGLDLLLARKAGIQPDKEQWMNSANGKNAGELTNSVTWRELILKHQRPEAQVTAGRLLSSLNQMGAVNDISDGLASELWEIAEASNVSLRIEQARIPLSSSLLAYAQMIGKDPLAWALNGGEDYQLVGTVPSEHSEELAALFEQNGLSFIRIGEVMEPSAEKVRLIDPAGMERAVHKSGYNHFRRQEGGE